MKIFEYDLRLYGLLRRCLRGDYVSPARDALTPAMRAGMLRTLRGTEVGKRCECGSACCRSFSTLAAPKGWDELFTVRFRVNGELHVTCDAEGTIHRVQWLRDEVREKRNLRCYTQTPRGWQIQPVADAD